MRVIEQRQQMHIQEPIKESILKQAAITKRIDISNLRHSPNAETKTNRINNMLRPTNFKDECFNHFIKVVARAM